MLSSPFFDDVRQAAVTIRGERAMIPAFYYDGTASTAVFPTRLSALRELMPDRRYSPARLAPGVGAIAISAFEYRDTDLRPYNELSIAIPLNEPYFRVNAPGRALAGSARHGQYHAFVWQLPVTTEIARNGGVDFYNYPKFLASIDFENAAGRRSCRLAEGAEPIFELDGPSRPGHGERAIQVFSHIWMDGQPQSSEFKLNAHEVRQSVAPGAARLKLGARHPIALELSRLLLSTRSIAFQHIPSFEGILYGPEHVTITLLQRAQDALTGGENHDRARTDSPATIR